ncbi:MAG TPA: hypothetical protein VGS41_05770, partial [Chthonomonadales bacterium]|nr:hypothetical protein [Chthonomonadales bacterium]
MKSSNGGAVLESSGIGIRMRSRPLLRCGTLGAIGLLAAATITAGRCQGTLADYERANNLRKETAGKVFRASVVPHWIEGTDRFWYRNDLPAGHREFILIDPAAASRKPAFDHARLAAALTRTLGRPVSAESLPISEIEFTGGKLRLQVEDKSYTCDLSSYALSESNDPLVKATPLPLDLPRLASRLYGPDTSLTFVNHTSQPVSLFWMDTAGNRVDYGSLAPQAKRTVHTYARHVWLVTKQDGTPVAAYSATEEPSWAVIAEGPPAPVVRRRQRRGFTSPDGKWNVAVKQHNVYLTEVSTGEQKQLSTDGSKADSYGGAVYWAPDSAHFVILKTIPAQEHKIYEVESSPPDQVQPKLRVLDYLKPGDKIEHPRP